MTACAAPVIKFFVQFITLYYTMSKTISLASIVPHLNLQSSYHGFTDVQSTEVQARKLHCSPHADAHDVNAYQVSTSTLACFATNLVSLPVWEFPRTVRACHTIQKCVHHQHQLRHFLISATRCSMSMKYLPLEWFPKNSRGNLQQLSLTSCFFFRHMCPSQVLEWCLRSVTQSTVWSHAGNENAKKMLIDPF